MRSAYDIIRIREGGLSASGRTQRPVIARAHEFDTAVPTGFEPAISSLTGTYARPLHHGTVSSRAAREDIHCAKCVEKEAASALPFTRRPAGVALISCALASSRPPDLRSP